LARRYGATDEEIATLGDLDASPLSDAEKAAIRFAESMTKAHGEIDRDDVAALLAHWDVGQAVEIACVAGTFNYLNRFAVAFGLWPTRPGEGGPEDPSEDGAGGDGAPGRSAPENDDTEGATE
jgi:alkylhydroperoxidase family enzyme